MKVNNYPVKTPVAGDKLFGSDANGNQVQFDSIYFGVSPYIYEIGQYVESEGGVVFHRYIDNGTQYYLIVDTNDLSSNYIWSNVIDELIGSSAESTWDGLSNSNAIISQSGFTNGAANLCLDSTNNSQTDWYLPAFDELNLLFNNRFNVNITLSGNSSYGSISGATQILNNIYWTSTEVNSTSSVAFDIRFGTYSNNTKNVSNYIRAIRKFSI